MLAVPSRRVAAMLRGALVVALFLPIFVAPGWLVDALVGCVMGGSVAVLAAALGRRIDRFRGLPAMLLIFVALRLSAGIAITRLAVVEGRAGMLLAAIAADTVARKAALAAILALLLLANYLVIGGGAARMAEVRARFALDAMPGRQLAIDGELRAGSIDVEEAARRRRELEEEGRFFGAMDGALRLTRSDAIVALLVPVAIVLVGSLAAVWGRDVSWAAALRRMGPLALSAGLALASSSLALSLAAGLVIARSSVDEEKPAPVPIASWELAVGVEAYALLGDRPGANAFAARLARRLFERVGLPVAERSVRVDATLDARAVVLLVRDVPAATFVLEDGSAIDALEAFAECVLLGCASELFDVETTGRLVDALARTSPASVRGVVPERVALATLAEVLAKLVAERVSVRDLAAVIDAIAAGKTGEAPWLLVERVRQVRKRAITHALLGGADELRVCVLDAMLEETLRGALDERRCLALAVEPARDVVRAIVRAVDEARVHCTNRAPVLLVAPVLRPHVRDLVATELSELFVTSAAELLSDVKVRAVATATLTSTGRTS